ncbi:hypothetical protein B0G76_2864 [Paraburkholderia sp. BL23I1N1]|nr:hypothetical protein B0G76_2864 [Paraburkholderia sp. BL23I1N1]
MHDAFVGPFVGLAFGCAACVLSTRRIGMHDWRFWAILVLMGTAYVLGTLA